jgi:hypothetical protein
MKRGELSVTGNSHILIGLPEGKPDMVRVDFKDFCSDFLPCAVPADLDELEYEIVVDQFGGLDLMIRWSVGSGTREIVWEIDY